MKNNIRFSHINIITKDWKRLANFYIEVFDCIPVYPERDLSGKWIDKVTNITDVEIKGIHLSLPGYTDAPTIEIFEYNSTSQHKTTYSIDDMGFRHIAFHVDNVEETLKKLIDAGGSKYGKLVETYFEGIGDLKVVYAKDIDGNLIEIQNWRKTDSFK